MKERCLNEHDAEYHNYGGRGISVCAEWMEFEPFKNWALSNGYANDLTIDRIDVNGNYCPENCRWTTYKVQANNKRNNRFVEYDGRRQTIAQWAEEIGMDYNALLYRLTNFSTEKAFTMPRLRRSSI